MSAEALIVVGEGFLSEAELTVTEGDPSLIALRLPSGVTYRGEGGDLFEALTSLREGLEEQGLRVACQGSLINVRPSAMLRQWTGGRRAYVLKKPRTHESPPVVDILSPAPVDAHLATVAEQAAWFEEWVNQPLTALPEPEPRIFPQSAVETIIREVRDFCRHLDGPGLSARSQEILRAIESEDSPTTLLLLLQRHFRLLASPGGPMPQVLQEPAGGLVKSIDDILAE